MQFVDFVLAPLVMVIQLVLGVIMFSILVISLIVHLPIAMIKISCGYEEINYQFGHINLREWLESIPDMWGR